MPVRSAWLINRTETESGQSRTDTRLAPVGTFAPTGALSSVSGVVPGSDGGQHLMDALYVEGAGVGMTAKVSPGRAVIQGSAQAGAYPVVLTDYEQVTFDDGDASNPRIDLVVLRVRDDAADGLGETGATLEVVKGTPKATPEAPTTPLAALALARVTVQAGASVGTGGIAWATDVYDLRRPTVAAGGILAESWNRNVNGGYRGQYRDTSAQFQRWDGERWVSYPIQVGGVAPQGALASGEYTGQYRDEAGRLQRWDGTVWRPAVASPPSTFTFHNDGGYTTSTSWVESITDTTGPTLTANFIAPVSEQVLITVGFMGYPAVDGQWGMMSVNIRKNGVLVHAADEVRAAQVSHKGGSQSVSHTFPIYGLEPGATYSAVSAYRSSATSSKVWYDNRYIRVDPVL
ncbi:hypothetical protein [Streptomyces sp. NPDC006879]|uniref:hypothetical protein n=1 Tax=Streptomyces sp. NPDC006879 TaxID=3364767 RepID=UPI0036ABE932